MACLGIELGVFNDDTRLIGQAGNEFDVVVGIFAVIALTTQSQYADELSPAVDRLE